VFPESAVSSEYWRWKYRGAPYGHGLGSVAFTPEGRLVAFNGAVPMLARFLGEEHPVVQSTDAMSHPEYRGRVLGRRNAFVLTALHLARRCGDLGIRFGYGFPNDRHLKLGGAAIGYRLLYWVQTYARLLGGEWHRRRPETSSDGFRVSAVDSFGDAADRFWNEVRDEYPSAVVRDARYLRWRYGGSARFRYHPFALEENGLWRGWVILSVRGEKAYLVDALLSRSTPVAESVRLVEAALDFAARQGARICQTWLPEISPAKPALIRAAFQPIRALEIPVTAHDLSHESGLDFKALSDTFYVQMGDSDGY
jgi:hypothetical protein